jgi:hypothetical protein
MIPRMEFLEHATRNLFFTGKGGVGKTSLACASAARAAVHRRGTERPRRTRRRYSVDGGGARGSRGGPRHVAALEAGSTAGFARMMNQWHPRGFRLEP